MQQKALLGATGLALTTLIATGCSASGGSDSDEGVTFVSYGPGTYQDGQVKAWLEPYEKENDVSIELDGPSDEAKLKAMVTSGDVTWDVMDTGAISAIAECGTLFEEIEIGEIEGEFPEGTLSPCGVPDALFGLIFMYNEKTYGDNPPTKLADFYDTENFPGKRLLYSGEAAVGNIEASLLGDGVAPDDLYPLDLNRAYANLDSIRSDVSFADTYVQQQQFLVDDQADMTLVVSARAYSTLSAGGTQWKPVWDMVPVTWDVLAVPKGSPNKEEAEDLITFASQPEQAAGFAAHSGAGPANTAAEPELNDLQRQVDVFGEHPEAQVVLDAEWWADNYTETVESWTNWMTG